MDKYLKKKIPDLRMPTKIYIYCHLVLYRPICFCIEHLLSTRISLSFLPNAGKIQLENTKSNHRDFMDLIVV